jgi:hypothetical protein
MRFQPIASHPDNERVVPESDFDRSLLEAAINGLTAHRGRLLVGEQPGTHHRLSANVLIRLTGEWNEGGESKAVGQGDLEYSSSGHRCDRRWRLTTPAVFWYSLARKTDGRLVVMRRVESTGTPSSLPDGFDGAD